MKDTSNFLTKIHTKYEAKNKGLKTNHFFKSENEQKIHQVYNITCNDTYVYIRYTSNRV